MTLVHVDQTQIMLVSENRGPNDVVWAKMASLKKLNCLVHLRSAPLQHMLWPCQNALILNETKHEWEYMMRVPTVSYSYSLTMPSNHPSMFKSILLYIHIIYCPCRLELMFMFDHVSGLLTLPCLSLQQALVDFHSDTLRPLSCHSLFHDAPQGSW